MSIPPCQGSFPVSYWEACGVVPLVLLECKHFLSTCVNFYVWVCKHMYPYMQKPEVNAICLPATFILIAWDGVSQ